MSSASDPQSWVTNPPSVLVKVRDITAKPHLNGELGVVVGYLPDRTRYVVVTCRQQEQLSLKPENLHKANFLEQAKGQYQLLTNDPRVRRQLQQVYHRVQTKLPAPLQPEHVAVVLLLLILASGYFLGVSKTLMIVSLLLGLATLAGPEIAAGKSWEQIGRDLPRRATSTLRDTIRQSVPYVGPKLADTPYVVPALLGILLAGTVKVLLLPAQPRVPLETAATALRTEPGAPRRGGALPDAEELYKLGFDDATSNLAFGTSLSPPSVVPDDFLVNDDYSDMPSLTTNTRVSPWNWSTLMSVFYLGRTMYALGWDPVQGAWSWGRAKANLVTQPTYQSAFLALSVYRVVSAIAASR
jgi:hypothetical protein